MTASRGRILVIRGGAIGDFILTLPAIAALRSRFPDAHLEVLGYPHIAQLALEGALVDRVRSIESRALAGFFASGGVLEPDWVDYFSEFDLILSYLYDPDEIFRTNVGRCSAAQFIAGPHRPSEKEQIPAAKAFLKPLERLAIFDADAVPRLSFHSSSELARAVVPFGRNPRYTLKPEDLDERGAFGAGRVHTLAVHPGSGSESKNWPEPSWVELLRYLLDRTEVNVLLVGGEVEGDRLRRLAASLPSARVETAQNLPLAALACKLQHQCQAFIGHDSGISHLAAALGLRGLILWGDAVEEIWRPPNSRVAILKGEQGPASISVERAWQTLIPLLVGDHSPP